MIANYVVALSANLLLKFVRLECITTAVLAVGLEHEVISPADVVSIELRRMLAGVELNPAEEVLALKLSDDLESVPTTLVADVDPLILREANHIWVYVGASKILETWGRQRDIVFPLATVIEEFNTPPPYSHLLYYGSRRSFKREYGKQDFFEALERRVSADRAHFGPGTED